MIGLIAHSAKPEAPQAVRDIAAALQKRRVAFKMEAQTAALIGRSSSLDDRELARQCDLLVVMGGDGTILRVVASLGSDLRPIFGINIGSLGFLTCAGTAEIPRAAESLAHKDYILSPRALLTTEFRSAGKPLRRAFGLNDVVISRGERSELVKLEVSIDGSAFTDYNADGLIVATPTGSTAYSLSAGGPILLPESGCFVITPICPHVLTNRSTVVSDRSIIEARLSQPGRDVFVTVDGQGKVPLGPGDVLRIARSRRQLPLAMLPERQFPEILRQKLKWSGSNI